MIMKTKENRKATFPSFYLADKVLNSDIWVISQGKTSVMMMIFRDNIVNYVLKPTCCHANVMCTDVMIALFKRYCTPLYTAYLWSNYSKGKYNKLRVVI